MIELTEDMTAAVATALADGCAIVAASVDPDGQPKLSFYGSTHVYSPTQLAIWVRNPESSVLTRIASNPRMTFLYRNPASRVGWQFYGQARVESDQGVRDRIYAGIPEIERMFDPDAKGVAVIIDLQRVVGRDLDMRAD